MEYYKRLYSEAVQGNKDSLRELKFQAGAGDRVAQYHLAQYYRQVSDIPLKENANYIWWMDKASQGNYKDSKALIDAVKPKPNARKAKNAQPFFQKLASPEGRITRTEYFTIILFVNILNIIVEGFFNWISIDNGALLRIVQLPIAYFGIIAGVKRCHDTGASGWRLLIPLYAIYLFFASGDKGENEYGADPRGR